MLATILLCWLKQGLGTGCRGRKRHPRFRPRPSFTPCFLVFKSGDFLDTAFGGGIANTDQAVLILTGSTFTGIRAVGGSNAILGNSAYGRGGVARGGALTNFGVATVSNRTFENNEVVGGVATRPAAALSKLAARSVAPFSPHPRIRRAGPRS